MKVRYAEFAACAVEAHQWPRDGLPEVALVGRSNVGKSSLINRLTGRKSLAKTSSTPGKTRTINFYRINKEFYIVDLPGFGYAKASRGERESWQRMVEGYIGERERLCGVVSVLDIRRDPGGLEEQLLEWLESIQLPVLAVLTKIDKLSSSRAKAREKIIREGLGADETTLFSAVSGSGKDELLKKITGLLEA